MADSYLMPTPANFSGAAGLVTAGIVQETISSVLREFSAASFEVGDVLAGIFRGIDTSKAVIPARAVSVQFNKILRKTPRAVVNSGLEGFEQFTKALGSLMRELHCADQPQIMRITPDAVSSAFLEKMVAIEEIRKFPENPVARRKDLKIRMTHPRRMILAWMDPFNPDGALISVQIALTSGKGKNFHDVVRGTDKVTGALDTATPYSVTNWGALDGLGTAFMYSVREAVLAEHPIKQMITLSPTEGFAKHLLAMPADSRPKDDESWLRMGYNYVLGVKKTENGYEMKDAVARGHMGTNGAVFDGITLDANPAQKEVRGPAAHYRYLTREEGAANARALRKEGRVTYTEEVARLYRPNGIYSDGPQDLVKPV